MLSVLVLIATLAGGLAFRQRQLAENEAQRHLLLLYASDMRAAFQAYERGDAMRVQELLAAYSPPLIQSSHKDLRGFEWFYLRANTPDVTTLRGHSLPATSLAFSPDGSTLATGSADRTIKLWDTQTHNVLATLRGHAGEIRSAVFSPDGKTLATGSADKKVRVWDTASHRELAVLDGHSGEAQSIGFSPDGNILAIGSDDQSIKLWDTVTHKVRASFIGHSARVRSLALLAGR